MKNTFKAQNVLRTNRSREQVANLQKTCALKEDLLVDRTRHNEVIGQCQALSSRTEEHAQGSQAPYEAQGRIASELNKLNSQSRKFEKETEDFRKGMEILATLKNAQEDIQTLRRDLKKVLIMKNPTLRKSQKFVTPEAIPEAVPSDSSSVDHPIESSSPQL